MFISCRIRLIPALCLLTATLLAGCGKRTVDVDVHGVNYTRDPFSYAVSDPGRADIFTAGELIDPFAAGGTTCCVALPKKWQPGLKIHLRATHWLPAREDGSLPKVSEEHDVEVPPYPNGKPEELWVIRAADGGVAVISSNFQPDHPQWPGKVKGWPVPSLEYRRERWEIYRHHEEGGVKLYESLLAQLEKTPEAEAKEAWQFAKQESPSSIKNFSGPGDPQYLASLKKEYEEGLAESRRRLQRVMEERP